MMDVVAAELRDQLREDADKAANVVLHLAERLNVLQVCIKDFRKGKGKGKGKGLDTICSFPKLLYR